MRAARSSPTTSPARPGARSRIWSTTLEAAGCSAADVVHVTTYLTDRGDFEAFNEAFVQTFSEPYPARVTVLAQLVVPDLSIEVTAVAARPRA